MHRQSVTKIFDEKRDFYSLGDNSKSLCFIDDGSVLIIISKRRADVDALFLIVTI